MTTPEQAAGALRDAGWSSSTWPTMIAIGIAESSLVYDVVSKPNTNGTHDRGWLQINDVHQFDFARLLQPVYSGALSGGGTRSVPNWCSMPVM